MGQITKPPGTRAIEKVSRGKSIGKSPDILNAHIESATQVSNLWCASNAAVVERLREIRESLALNDWDRIHGDELDKLDALIKDLEP